MKQDATEVSPLDELDVQVWNQYWAEVERRIAPLFARSDAHHRAITYLAGLLSPVERKNSWQLAEVSGDVNPYGFQNLLGRACWDADALRDCLYGYVTDYLHDHDAIGVLDETGFLKKGKQSAGVARQYSGTAGRIENCQIGVFVAYASRKGHTLLDRELYLPEEWISDPERCRQAGIPAERTFATKPALAIQMLQRSFAAGVRFSWITGDSVYGDNRPLRQWLEERSQPYVLALSGKEWLWKDGKQQQVTALLNDLPNEGWQQLSAGTGTKGPRIYDWLKVELSTPTTKGFERHLLVRRSLSNPLMLTAYLVFAPVQTSLLRLVKVAGMRWTVEESIQTAKGEVGLDHYEVRSWTGWYRHISLVMWAQAFLSVVRAERGADAAPKKGLSKRASVSSLARFKAQRGLQPA